MFAISTIVKRTNGTHDFHDGILHPLPAELSDNVRRTAYLAVTKPGWTVGEFGYKVYCAIGLSSDLFIFPGLWLIGERAPSKKFMGHSPIYTRTQIETYAAGVLKLFDSISETIYKDVNNLVHDFRSISTEIYNSAVEAERFFESENPREGLKRIENIKACQAMLKMRTDALDFTGNPDTLIDDKNIPVFRKVDKVVRVFMSRRDDAARSKLIELRGPSICLIRGPDIFELIPYTLINNALKYSPQGQYSPQGLSVLVQVRDGSRVSVVVSSLGPRIDDDEKVSVFNRGFRGRHAQSSGISGSGLGLFLVEKLVVDHFKGAVYVEQGKNSVVINDTPYHETMFHVEVPVFTGQT